MKFIALIHYRKFLPPELSLFLYQFFILSFSEFCCHVCAGACTCYLHMLDKLQKQICRVAGSSRAASLWLLTHCQNLASLILLYRYHLDRCSFELAELGLFLHSRCRFTCYCNSVDEFFVTTSGYYKHVYVNSSSPRTAKLWNFLSVEGILWPMV